MTYQHRKKVTDNDEALFDEVLSQQSSRAEYLESVRSGSPSARFVKTMALTIDDVSNDTVVLEPEPAIKTGTESRAEQRRDKTSRSSSRSSTHTKEAEKKEVEGNKKEKQKSKEKENNEGAKDVSMWSSSSPLSSTSTSDKKVISKSKEYAQDVKPTHTSSETNTLDMHEMDRQEEEKLESKRQQVKMKATKTGHSKKRQASNGHMRLEDFMFTIQRNNSDSSPTANQRIRANISGSVSSQESRPFRRLFSSSSTASLFSPHASCSCLSSSPSSSLFSSVSSPLSTSHFSPTARSSSSVIVSCTFSSASSSPSSFPSFLSSHSNANIRTYSHSRSSSRNTAFPSAVTRSFSCVSSSSTSSLPASFLSLSSSSLSSSSVSLFSHRSQSFPTSISSSSSSVSVSAFVSSSRPSQILETRVKNLAKKSRSMLLLEALQGKRSTELSILEKQIMEASVKRAAEFSSSSESSSSSSSASSSSSSSSSLSSPVSVFNASQTSLSSSSSPSSSLSSPSSSSSSSTKHQSPRRSPSLSPIDAAAEIRSAISSRTRNIRKRVIPGTEYIAECDRLLECVIQHLLNHGADANYEDADGNCPLYVVVQMKRNSNIVRWLLSKGANPNPSPASLSKRNDQQSFVDIAFRLNNAPLVFMLLKAGGLPSLACFTIRPVETKTEMVSAKDEAAEEDDDDPGNDNVRNQTASKFTCAPTRSLLAFANSFGFGQTARSLLLNGLVEAVQVEDLPTMKALLAHHVDIEHKDSKGRSLLYYAIENKLSIETIKCLLENGADPNSCDCADQPVILFPLVRHGDYSSRVLLLLLQYGADPASDIGDSPQSVMEFAQTNHAAQLSVLTNWLSLAMLPSAPSEAATMTTTTENEFEPLSVCVYSPKHCDTAKLKQYGRKKKSVIQ